MSEQDDDLERKFLREQLEYLKHELAKAILELNMANAELEKYKSHLKLMPSETK